MPREREIDKMTNTAENIIDIDLLQSFHPLLYSVCIKYHVEHFTIIMIYKNTKNMMLKNACHSFSTHPQLVTFISVCLNI